MRSSSSTLPAEASCWSGAAGPQQMIAAEDVQRQVAVVAVVAVEEAPLLVAVERVVGGVEIQHDLLRRLVMRVQEEPRRRTDRPPRCPRDLLVAVRLGGDRQPPLQPIQRALARQRLAPIRARACGPVRSGRDLPTTVASSGSRRRSSWSLRSS